MSLTSIYSSYKPEPPFPNPNHHLFVDAMMLIRSIEERGSGKLGTAEKQKVDAVGLMAPDQK
jgi:hypothetical protein